MNKNVGLIIAATVGVLFATASFAGTTSNDQLAKAASVKCVGGNSCKGKSACKTDANACKGQNSCKGKGFNMMKTEKACKKAHGTVEKAAKS